LRRAGYTVKLFLEFARFARENRVYWIMPLVVILGLTGLLIFFNDTATTEIYTLF
jgi:hypothetical protein